MPTRGSYQESSWWNPTHRNRQKASALLCGRQGQRSTVERSKVRVGSKKLAGGPRRNTEAIRQFGAAVGEMKGRAKGK